jgi:hypothetical protein
MKKITTALFFISFVFLSCTKDSIMSPKILGTWEPDNIIRVYFDGDLIRTYDKSAGDNYYGKYSYGKSAYFETGGGSNSFNGELSTQIYTFGTDGMVTEYNPSLDWWDDYRYVQTGNQFYVYYYSSRAVLFTYEDGFLMKECFSVSYADSYTSAEGDIFGDDKKTHHLVLTQRYKKQK